MSQSIGDELRARLTGTSDDQAVEILFAFMCERGQSHYDEAVTQLAHALQCAQLAADDGCDDAAVTAALFHDIGHLLLDEHDMQSGFLAEDLNHEESGANWLEAFFPAEVTEPVRLHVPAKRYLCSTDQTYYDTLSEASKRSFQVQGGQLTADEQAELETNAGLQPALRLRRFDDLGKQPDCEVPEIGAYTEHVKRCLRPDRP